MGKNVFPARAGGKQRRPLEIVYEDGDVLVVNKPAGLITSSTPREKRPTLLKMVESYLNETEPRSRAGVIHRLDADAAGLLVFSKNNFAYHALKAQFFRHTVQRIYHTVVHGTPNPPAGQIESRLVEWVDGTMHTTKPPKGQVAVTHYEVVEKGSKRALLRVTLQTGRKHQIRVHLAGANHPIVGDPVYGPGNDGEQRMMLCATELGFEHPRTRRTMHFRIDVPKEFARALVAGKRVSQ